MFSVPRTKHGVQNDKRIKLAYTSKQITTLNRWALGLSMAIPLAVLLLLSPGLIPRISLPFDPYLLPPFYATINGLTAIILCLALYFIKQKNVARHMQLIYIAMGLSVIFLISYVLYHWSTEPTGYGGDGLWRNVYYFFLLTHILLSGIVVPFVLFTFIRGLTGQIEKHRALAVWTFPIWLYVAVTGVICYLMLAPYYP